MPDSDVIIEATACVCTLYKTVTASNTNLTKGTKITVCEISCRLKFPLVEYKCAVRFFNLKPTLILSSRLHLLVVS